MQTLGRLLSYLINGVTVLAGLSVALMMVHITADVISRYAFNYPLPGTITIVSNFYMVLVAFLPLAFVEQKGAHISVEVLTERFPPAVQRHLAAWLLPLSVAIFSVLTVRTWGEAMTKMEINAAVVQAAEKILIWPTFFFLPLGCGLMVLVLAYKFVVYLTGTRSGIDSARIIGPVVE
ncbi:MAG: TRAP transporter small permease [Pseudomonadota bacterium]